MRVTEAGVTNNGRGPRGKSDVFKNEGGGQRVLAGNELWTGGLSCGKVREGDAECNCRSNRGM